VERSGLYDKERNSSVIIFEFVELSLFPDIRVPKKVNKRRRIKTIKRKDVIKSCIVQLITT
jgi:hypothetical protein